MSVNDPMLAPLERLSLTSPLGLRFWDVAAGKPVTGGLLVTATAPNGKTIRSVENRSGVYVFTRLPGLPVEPAVEGKDYFEKPPAPITFRIEVSDASGRFLDTSFTVAAPVQRLCSFSPTLPGVPDRYVPLFSTTQRTSPPGFGCVRAELVHAENDEPLAWALLEVTDGHTGQKAWGVSDADGRVALFFPYPETDDALVESLPHSIRRLADQVWDLALAIKSKPSALSFATETSTAPLLPSLLGQTAGILLDLTSPPTALTQAQLRYGEDLVLRSTGSPPLSVLFVQPSL